MEREVASLKQSELEGGIPSDNKSSSSMEREGGEAQSDKLSGSMEREDNSLKQSELEASEPPAKNMWHSGLDSMPSVLTKDITRERKHSSSKCDMYRLASDVVSSNSFP